MLSHIYRSHISFSSTSEALAFEEQLSILQSVRDMRINDAYVDPQRFGKSVRIDIEAMSDKVFSRIYHEIVLHLLLGNGHKPIKDHVVKFRKGDEPEKLTMVNPKTLKKIQELTTVN